MKCFKMKRQRLVLTTATALEDSSSSGDMEEKYAMFVSVYTNVTSGMEMYMARGRFLRKDIIYIYSQKSMCG